MNEGEQHPEPEQPQSEAPAVETPPKTGGVRFAEQVEQLEKKVAEAETKATQNWDKALRAVAELENVKRRAERDVESAHKYALEKFSNALLPVIDSLEKALEVKVDAPEIQSMRQGIEMTLKMFTDTVAKFGLEMVNPMGQEYDPHVHEAMTLVDNAEVQPNTVIAVYQKGWKLNGRLVRPARVVVSK
jgi:molecular chaperone GrpE